MRTEVIELNFPRPGSWAARVLARLAEHPSLAMQRADRHLSRATDVGDPILYTRAVRQMGCAVATEARRVEAAMRIKRPSRPPARNRTRRPSSRRVRRAASARSPTPDPDPPSEAPTARVAGETYIATFSCVATVEAATRARAQLLQALAKLASR